MPRIAYFIDSPTYGGGEAVLISLCKGVREQGFDPIVFLFENTQLEAKCREENIIYKRAPEFIAFKSIKSIHKFGTAFANVLKEYKTDLLHSHLFGAIIAGSISARLAFIPDIATIHDSYTIEERFARIRLLQFAVLSGTKVITVCKHIENFLHRHAWFVDENLKTIYNGVDLPELDPIIRTKIRSELQLSEDEVAITSVGRLVELKRFERLIRSFQPLKEKYKTKLFIIGDGPERDNLNTLINDLRLSDHVKLLGFREKVSEYLQASDIFTLVSRTEGFCCSVLAAQASALPCVVTNVGGNRELVTDNESGIIIKSDTLSQITSSLETLLDDQSKRKEMGKVGRARALKHFAKEVMIRDYIQSYNDILKR